jgi:hypothetical protein
MPETAASPLAAWASFYVIVGSAAAVLTGLMAVAITLLPETRQQRWSETMEADITVFGTSTIVHFCAVLLVAVLLSAPWDHLSRVALLLGLAGLSGVAYTLITTRRLRRRHGSTPEGEVWVWYIVAPLVAYAALASAALLVASYPQRALFGMAAVLLVLLFVGLRNVWDVVIFMALRRLQQQSERGD